MMHLFVTLHAGNKRSEIKLKERVQRHAAGIDGGNARRSRHNNSLACRITEIAKKSGFARSGLAGKEKDSNRCAPRSGARYQDARLFPYCLLFLLYKSRLLKAGTVAGDCAVSAALPVAVYQIERDLHGVESRSFLIWSATIQNASPLSSARSLRSRPTNTGSVPAASRGIG